MATTDEQLRGIGGWLLLLAVVLLGTPGTLLRKIDLVRQQFASPELHALMTPSGPRYDPRWQELATIQIGGSGIAAVTAIGLIFLFFVKHRSFPAAFVIFMVSLAGLTLVQLFLVYLIPTVAQSYRNTLLTSTVASVVISSVWIAYIFRSRRVRLTFTRRFYFTPIFPFFGIA